MGFLDELREMVKVLLLHTIKPQFTESGDVYIGGKHTTINVKVDKVTAQEIFGVPEYEEFIINVTMNNLRPYEEHLKTLSKEDLNISIAISTGTTTAQVLELFKKPTGDLREIGSPFTSAAGTGLRSTGPSSEDDNGETM
ncbi:hypothetical protein ACFL7E_01930 [Thermodesulfobacteriota bacterium]